jgi:hypothetical protein
MIKRTVKYIHNLRILFLFFIPFCFFLVLGMNPVDLSRIITGKMGQAVGISVGVSENKYNKLAAQLEDKEDRLDAREGELALLEKKMSDSYKGQETLILFLFAGIMILFMLVSVNYYLDYKRKKMSYR